MKRVEGIFGCIAICLACLLSHAQSSRADSLTNTWLSTSKEDTIRLSALHTLLREYYLFSDPDSTRVLGTQGLALAKNAGHPAYTANLRSTMGSSYLLQGDMEPAEREYSKALKIFESLDDMRGCATVLGNLGLVYYYQNEYSKAILYHSRALKLHEQSSDHRGMANALGNLGLVYYDKDDYPKSLEYQFKALKLYQEQQDQRGLANTHGNIALVYRAEGYLDSALMYHRKTLLSYRELNDNRGIADSYGNLGSLFKAMGDLDKALKYHTLSLELEEQLGNEAGMAASMVNIGDIYKERGQYQKALHTMLPALEISRKTDDKKGLATAYGKLGMLYLVMGENEKALSFCKKSYKLCQTMDWKDLSKDACQCQSNAHENLGNPTEALEFYKLYIQYRDDIYNQENTALIARTDERFRNQQLHEEVLLKDSLKNAEKFHQQEIEAAAEIMSEKNIRTNILWSGSVVAALLGILALVLYRGNKNKQKANEEITSQKLEVEKQKEVVDMKNQEILSSIKYAKRLQEVILPPPRLVKEYLNDSFILYKPRDIVAGDFYWMEADGDEVWYAAADCTGHGVPGAMVSVVCANALNRSFHEFGLRDPGKILDKVRDLVIQTYSQSDQEVRDGMDIALVRHNTKTQEVHYAGANRPLWVVRRGIETMLELSLEEVLVTSRTMSLAGCTLAEVKPNRQPIGVYEKTENFTTNKFSMREGDTLYLFSDGFADQFGGADASNPEGKKFKYRSFKKLLCSINEEDMSDQKSILNKVFSDWRGDLDQVDDVCILGVRV